MFYLGVPVKDNHKLTNTMLESLYDTVIDKEQFHIVLFDNGSKKPYKRDDPDLEYANLAWCSIVRFDTNHGYYQPILDLYNFKLGNASVTDADIIGLGHNDLFFYEKGWDKRLREVFVQHPNLGMVGFCGSNKVDDRGGRGDGTMVNFRGVKGARTEDTGRRITGLEPAVVFDSLFMAMRRNLVPLLKVDENFQLCHFGDRVWPLRLIENGWQCAVLGIEIDHMGGQTAVLVPSIEDDDRRWCESQGIIIPEGMTGGQAQYLEAEKRYLSEYRDLKHMVPGRVTSTWTFRRDGV